MPPSLPRAAALHLSSCQRCPCNNPATGAAGKCAWRAPALPPSAPVSGIMSARQQKTEWGSSCAYDHFADRHVRARLRRSGRGANRPGTGGPGRESAYQRSAAGREGEGAIIVTATKRASTVQDVPFSINAQTQADIQRANAHDPRGYQPQRRRPDRPESRAGPEPGLDPRRVRRPDRPRPTGREGTGRRLSRRKRRSRYRCSRPTSTCST